MPDVPGDSSCGTISTSLTPIAGTLETIGDHDWYRIELQPGQQITVSLAAAGSSPLGDPYLIIRDELGNIVDFDDESGDGSNSLLTFASAAGGIYYIDAGSYQGATTGDYQLTVSNTPGLPTYRTDQIANYLVNTYWTSTGFTAHHWNVASGGSLSVNLTALAADAQVLARQALAEWTDVTGIHFVEVASGGQIQFDDNVLGKAYCNAGWSGGIMTSASINIGSDWIARYGTGLNSYSLQTYVHEIGHALGLGHAGNYDGSASYPTDATYRNDSWALTVMSYFTPTQNTYFRDEGFTSAYALTPMLADIYAVQAIYGTPTTTRTGDTVYGFNSNAGPVFDATICPSARYTIVDNGGTDTLDYSGYSTNQTINLGSVTYDAGWMTFSNVGSGVGNVCIAPGTVIENAIGGSGNDIFLGNNWNNVLDGGLGNDTASYANSGFQGVVVSLAIQGPQDTLSWSGTDTLVSIENLTGSAGNDTLTGDSLANVLRGGPGSDILDGGEGNDRLVGGNGAERLIGGQGNDYLDGGAAYDTADYRQAAQGVQVDLSVSGPQDTGGGGVDTLVSVESVDGSAFDDVLTGNGDYNNLVGLDGNDVLSGGAFFDYLYGNAGNDYLDGGEGDDHLTGGIGNDVYVVDSLGDVITEAANEGTDEIRTGLAAFSLETISNVETLVGTGISDQQLSGNGDDNRIDGGEGADVMAGGAGNDIYIVDNAGDSVAENDSEGTDEVRSSVTFVIGANVENLTLLGTAAINGTGNSVANALTGNGSANILDGGTGSDTMSGGKGDDTYVVDDSGDRAIEGNATGGNDLVNSSVSFTLGANVERLTLTGASVVNGTGNSLANILIGNSAANILNGGSGADQMTGGLGNDIYIVDNAADIITELAGEGVDSVRTALSWTLGANLETLLLTGAGAVDATGNSSDNSLTGNSAANVLSGLEGRDVITGGVGNDSLYGGVGDDTLNGGAGNDLLDGGGDLDTASYEGVAIGVTVSLATAAAQNTIGAGIDTLVGVENLTGTASAADHLTGNSASNLLIGLGGNDTLSGGGGDDTLNGSDGLDTEYGGSGSDALNGGAGNDKLDGGAGDDLMRGGDGNDLYFVDSSGDRVREGSNEGTDTVRSTITYVLDDNIESATLLGNGNVDATGNGLANLIRGNTGANTLIGAAGADTLIGGAGNDQIDGGSERDVLSGNTGADIFIIRDGDTGASQATADKISDFSTSDGDKIDLHFMDANSANGGGTNETFSFIGTSAFSHTAGELRYEVIAGFTVLTGDMDGDGIADMMIRLTGSHTMTSADFVL